MISALETRPMAKAKRNDVSVKIDAEAYRLVKTAASWLGEDIAEYLSRVAAEAARRDVAKIPNGLAPLPRKRAE